MSYASPSTHAGEEGAHVAYIRAVRAHPVLVGFIVLAALATAFVWQHSRTPSYEATAQVLVTPVAEESAYVGLPGLVTSSSSDPSRTMQTATSILETPGAAALAASNLGRGWTKQLVGQSISVAPRGESNVISITGKADGSAKSAALAAAYARAALALHAKLLGDEAKLQVEQLQARARRLTAAEGSEASQIGSQLAALNAVAAGHDPNFSLLQVPFAPGSPSGTSKTVILALALLAGLVIAVGAAVLTDYLNRRARDEDEILSTYPLPVLVRVPILPRGARDAVSPDRVPPGVREAFRTLQPQLPQIRDGRAVMFTSASPRDGKTSAAINFAFVLAAAGFRVILFDFDLRRPDVGRRLGVNSDFMDLFRADAKLEDLLKEPPGAPGLRVISSRAQGGETTALVDAVARRLPELLDRARQLADYVIVDTPPLGQISDGLRAAMVVDDIVLVARPGNTNRVELEHTRELLDRMDRTPSGLVVIGLQTVGDAYETYGLEPGTAANGDGPSSGAIDEALPWTGTGRRSERQRRAEADEDQQRERGSRRAAEGGRKVRRMQASDADEFGAERGKPITRPPA